MRDATAVIEKQHRAIAALNQKVSHLQALVDQSPHIAKAIARDPALLMKTVDLLLAESDTARKDAAAHPVRDAPTEPVKAANAGRLFTRHGGNVLPALRG
jgi:glutamine synthetase adenylyltransferase